MRAQRAPLRPTFSPARLCHVVYAGFSGGQMETILAWDSARGIAQLMRLGWFRPVHCKSMAAQEVRALLTARKLVQSKLLDVQMSLRGLLRGFGLKVGATTPSRFAGRIRDRGGDRDGRLFRPVTRLQAQELGLSWSGNDAPPAPPFS